MKNQFTLLFLLSVIPFTDLWSQKNLTPHTLTATEHFVQPKATIEEVAWIVGEYDCPAFGGVAHEVWTKPRGGNMIGAFQLVDGDNISFYEIMSIVEKDGSLLLRLKHFDTELKGWEEKDETVDFPLVKIDAKNAYFDGLTFEYVSRKRMNVYVAIDHDGEVEEALFAYQKLKK
jgi:hypothetical protein